MLASIGSKWLRGMTVFSLCALIHPHSFSLSATTAPFRHHRTAHRPTSLRSCKSLESFQTQAPSRLFCISVSSGVSRVFSSERTEGPGYQSRYKAAPTPVSVGQKCEFLVGSHLHFPLGHLGALLNGLMALIVECARLIT